MLVPTLRRALLLGTLLLPAPLFAQGAVLSGTVTDSATGSPLPGAQLEARTTGAVAGRVQADNRGRFRLALPAGRYTLAISSIGYAPRSLEDIAVVEETPRRVDVALARMPFVLPTIEAVSRSPQEIIDAPGAASVVGHQAIEDRTALTPSDHLRDVPGISLASKGLGQATFSARGPGAVNSAALLVLHDYRLASVPSLRLNVPYLIPVTSEDLDRIEVARGPSSAIYGPDADRGVVNFITKSPFASRGTTVSFAAGERSVVQAGLRHASQLGQRVAVKLSGEYFEGDDWKFRDTNEVVPRDRQIERASGELRLDWRGDDRTTVILSGGLAQAINNVDQSEIGSIQVRDWRYTFGQARVLRDRLMVNLFYNQNDAGRTFQLYTGAPIVENSRAMSAQAQYGSALGPRIDLTYGVDVQRVIPRTGGTIHGRNEDRDHLTQTGLYLSTSTALSSRWSLIAAARADHHNRLDDFAVSPRAGLVFKPGPNHALRLTFNRATSTPVANDLFLDLQASDNLGGLPYEIRARGTINAFTFRRDCNGGLCMRSPFVGNAAGFLPLDATLGWQGLVQILQTQGIDISAVPAPTTPEVSTVLAVLNPATQGFDAVSPSDVTDIPAGRRSYNSTVEAGYRGYLSDRFSLSLDVYHSRLTNVGNPLTVQTPNVFLDRTTLTAYLSNYLPPQDAAAIAAAASGIPLGVVSPLQGDSTEILLIGRQGARASYWGADLALAAGLGPYVTVSGTSSWTSKDLVRSVGGFSDIIFNSPKRSGSLGLALHHAPSGWGAELRGRAVSSFPVRSGEYNGRVASYAVLDASLSYWLPWPPGVTVGVSAANFLDNRHQEFVGAPAIGRLVMVRLRGEF
jgi:iron complex outermembrane receptor protein